MKSLLLLILLIPAVCLSQFNPSGSGPLQYEKVFERDLSSSDLHAAVKEWIAKSYNDPDHVIKLNTPDKILVNGIFDLPMDFSGQIINMTVSYDLTAAFKDGRYKINIDQVALDNGALMQNQNLPDFETYKSQVKKSLKELSGAPRKAAEKMLKNEKQIRKTYEQSVGYQGEILSGTKEYLQQLVQGLETYIKEYDPGSDW